LRERTFLSGCINDPVAHAGLETPSTATAQGGISQRTILAAPQKG
jgi:hypothetical protein